MYKPYFENSPFNMLAYTLVRNQKQLNKVLKNSNYTAVFNNLDASAQVTSFLDDTGKDYLVVQLGNTTGKDLLEVFALLVHESVHIWQAIVESMREHYPSKEFEAYSIQLIALNLFQMYQQSEESS